ncbi:MAG TPA: flagellin, partial [Methylophilaceae bacterium]
INRAADDAAGLAISEKMRAQIAGLQTAQRNAQDAISLIQTAEGALNETHSILQRMRELAVQAASDTNTAADRAQIQKEIDQLAQEVGRIAATTEFNTQKLLDGSFATNGITFQIGANKGQSISVTIADMGGVALGVVNTTTAKVNGSDTNLTSSTLEAGTYTVRDNSGTLELVDSSGKVVATAASAGATANAFNNASGTVLDLGSSTVSDGDTIVIGGLDVTSQASASQAISALDSAIEKVSGQRADLGAVQNRLEHTIANLGVAIENLQAAESRIRDVDMALEMANFTRNQILLQSGTAMLAQANAMPQAVLQLLGG